MAGQIRSPFKQGNLSSSSSLEGMEKPVRSFKSFIKAVPPHPGTTTKPLPPTPVQDLPSALPSTASSSCSPARTSSATSWKAPNEWLNGNPDVEQSSLHTPPILSARTYSPLLPDPSPELQRPCMEFRTASGSPQQKSHQMALYERTNPELGPPRSPPRSPLPLLPITSNETVEAQSEQRGRPPDPPAEKEPSAKHAQVALLDLKTAPEHRRTASPAQSLSSQTSHASTKERAFASLGIGSPREQSRVVEYEIVNAYDHETIENYGLDGQSSRGKKLPALKNGDPLADNSWETMEMDKKRRQLGSSQDYHDPLANQYQEMNIQRAAGYKGAKEVNVTSPRKTSRAGQLPKKHELVPRPLSWRKSSNGSSQRSGSQIGIEHENDNDDQDQNEKLTADKGQSTGAPRQRRSKRITSWVPKRLSVRPKRSVQMWKQKNKPASKPAEDTEMRIRSIRYEDIRSIRDEDIPPIEERKSEIPSSQVDKILKSELRFSNFFPAGKTLRLGRKLQAATKRPTSSPVPVTAPSLAPSPVLQGRMIRLPGGITIIKTSSSLARNSKTDNPGENRPTTRPDQSRPNGSVSSEHATSPTSDVWNPSDLRSSYTGSQTHRPPTRPGTVPDRAIYSASSSNYSSPSSSSTHLALPEARHPPLLPLAKSPPARPPQSGKPDRPERPVSTPEEHRLNFLERAREARKKHVREARQEKLKRQIRVLGPTDPMVVSGFVREDGTGRRPGYMVGGLV